MAAPMRVYLVQDRVQNEAPVLVWAQSQASAMEMVLRQKYIAKVASQSELCEQVSRGNLPVNHEEYAGQF